MKNIQSFYIYFYKNLYLFVTNQIIFYCYGEKMEFLKKQDFQIQTYFNVLMILIKNMIKIKKNFKFYLFMLQNWYNIVIV